MFVNPSPRAQNHHLHARTNPLKMVKDPMWVLMDRKQLILTVTTTITVDVNIMKMKKKVSKKHKFIN